MSREVVLVARPQGPLACIVGARPNYMKMAPLDSLPWLAPEAAREQRYERDPFAERPPLPPYARVVRDSAPPPARGVFGVVEQRVSPPDVVRTALCVEPRDGRQPRAPRGRDMCQNGLRLPQKMRINKPERSNCQSTL